MKSGMMGADGRLESAMRSQGESEARTHPATSRNKGPILEQLVKRIPRESSRILEIASGHGEHCAHFASHIPGLRICPTDPVIDGNFDSIRAWRKNLTPRLTEIGSSIAEPIALDVSKFFPDLLENDFRSVDCILCINMIHISVWPDATDGLFSTAAAVLMQDGFVFTYGPYSLNGEMVESNKKFDRTLRGNNCKWGIRGVEEVEEIAGKYGFVKVEIVEMPANNFVIIWKKIDLELPGEKGIRCQQG